MTIIYKITNSVNNKVYIGKTQSTMKRRFNEHKSDAFRYLSDNRPLYRAMRKYGVDKFSIELIEKTDDSNSCNREIYWIKIYNSYKHGYNATKGGDGKSYLDHEKIVDLYLKLKTTEKVAKELNCNVQTVSSVLKNRNIKLFTDQTYLKVKAICKTTGEILVFDSLTEGSKFLAKLNGDKPKSHVSHISACCQGKRKSVLGYTWQYCRVEEESNR